MEFEDCDLKDEITVTRGALQNLVYSEDAAGEENVHVSDSPKNYIPDNNDGKKSLLAENSSGTSLRSAISDVEPPLLQQTSSCSNSLQQESLRGVSPVQEPYGGQLTPLAPTFQFAPRNLYRNTFSSDPNPSLGLYAGQWTAK